MKSTVEIPFFEGFCYTQLSDVEQEVNGLSKKIAPINYQKKRCGKSLECLENNHHTPI